MSRYQEIAIALPDGYRAYGRYYHSPPALGAVLYHHGIQSHCGWYEGSALALADAGYCVLQVDRRGSGRNEVARGHAESAEQLIADSHAARDDLLQRSGCCDYHLLGVSWGGKLAVAAHVNDPGCVRSLTLVTPGLFPKVGVSRTEMAKIGFSMLYEPNQLFDIPLNNPDRFTTNLTWAEFFRTDPLTLRQCTAAFYLASRRMDRVVARLKESPPVPIRLFLAGDEWIVDNDKTAEFVRGLGWPDTQTTTQENARHSLEFEGDPTKYFGQIVSFLKSIE